MSSDTEGDISADNLSRVSGVMEKVIHRNRDLISGLVGDDKVADEIVREALGWAVERIPELAYANNPGHPMASSAYFCHANLAIYLALRVRDIDAHTFGAAMLQSLRQVPPPAVSAEKRWRALQTLHAAAGESQQSAAPNEFVFEVFLDDEDKFEWRMNVKSCAICKSYAQHDAMDLVPYMCASDDIVSGFAGDGLRRSGTIALGAHQCDFRYQQGGEPAAVADAYPQQIRVTSL